MTPRRDPPFVVRQEPDALDRRRLLRIAVFVAVAFVIAVATSTALLGANESGREVRAARAAPPGVGTVERTLILSTARGLTERDEQRASLEHYGWNDRDAGRARIPIERAIDLVVERAESNDGGAWP